MQMNTLYTTIVAAFSVILVIANVISAKMVLIPYLNLILPVGLIAYPLTFLLSDLVTEIFGQKLSKRMVFIALGMNLLSLGIIYVSLHLPGLNQDEDRVFAAIMGLSGLRIFASLTAYLISQVLDITLYAKIKSWTGTPLLWVRTNVSTCISQLVDTAVVDIIYLWWGLGMQMSEMMPIMLSSYAYKAVFSVLTTPIFYICVSFLNKTMRVSHESAK